MLGLDCIACNAGKITLPVSVLDFANYYYLFHFIHVSTIDRDFRVSCGFCADFN